MLNNWEQFKKDKPLFVPKHKEVFDSAGLNIDENNTELREKIKEIDNYLVNLPKNSFLLGQTSTYYIRSFPGQFEYLPKGKETLDFIKEKLNNEIIIDIGCGGAGDDVMVLKDLGLTPKFYIGVDRVDFKESDVNKTKEKIPFPIEYIHEDMLRFVAKLPDNSVNFFISGTGFGAVEDIEYIERLKKEIKRATKRKGIIIQHCSCVTFNTTDTDFIEYNYGGDREDNIFLKN